MGFRIIVDTREQAEYAFPCPTERKKLEAGDYSAAGYEARLAVERKSLADFVHTVIYDFARFAADTSAAIRDRGLAALPPCSPEMPGLVERGARYMAALADWSAAGWPRRADEEIDRIYKTCCRPCDWRDAEKDVCRECGCPVQDAEARPVRNKIAMATEHCAKGLW